MAICNSGEKLLQEATGIRRGLAAGMYTPSLKMNVLYEKIIVV